MKTKIAVVGLGYVGLSNAVLLARFHDVVAVDIDTSRVDCVNKGMSPIVDDHISDYLSHHTLNLTATSPRYHEALLDGLAHHTLG